MFDQSKHITIRRTVSGVFQIFYQLLRICQTESDIIPPDLSNYSTFFKVWGKISQNATGLTNISFKMHSYLPTVAQTAGLCTVHLGICRTVSDIFSKFLSTSQDLLDRIWHSPTWFVNIVYKVWGRIYQIAPELTNISFKMHPYLPTVATNCWTMSGKCMTIMLQINKVPDNIRQNAPFFSNSGCKLKKVPDSIWQNAPIPRKKCPPGLAESRGSLVFHVLFCWYIVTAVTIFPHMRESAS